MAFEFNLAPPRVDVPGRDTSFLDTIMARQEDRRATKAAVGSTQGLTPEQIAQVTPLLSNAQTRAQGLKQIQEWRKPKEYGFDVAPDGTMLRTDAQGGTAEPIGSRGQYAAPRAKGAGGAEERAGLAAQYGLDPSSPEGRSYILTGTLPPNRQARVPAAIQNAEAGDLENLQGLSTMNSELNRFAGLIDEGKLDLGGFQNFLAKGKNFIGTSDENSRNFASFSATLEKLRNESLRLNKGVQTEGDSERAWNELIANINDPQVVKQRISEIVRLNGRAAEFRRNLVTQRRDDNNLDPLNIDKMISPSAVALPQGVTEDDVQHTMKVHGLSREQVLEKLQ